MRRILRQPAEAHLDHAELPLDHPEWMLHLGADARLAFLDSLERALLGSSSGLGRDATVADRPTAAGPGYISIGRLIVNLHPPVAKKLSRLHWY